MADNPWADGLARALTRIRDEFGQPDPFLDPTDPEDFDAVVAKSEARKRAERRASRWALGQDKEIPNDE